MESTPGEGSRFCLRLPFRLDTSVERNREPGADATRALVLAAESIGLMEVRTLLDRAGAITEAEQVDPGQGIDAMLHCVQRNRAWLDLLVVDLRHLEIDLEELLDSTRPASAPAKKWWGRRCG